MPEIEQVHLSIIPYIPLIVGIISVVGMGLFARWNSKRGAVEVKAPSVAEAWDQATSANEQLDIERRLRRWFETWFWKLVEAFGAYVTRVTAGGSTDLKPAEKKALEATPPSPK